MPCIVMLIIHIGVLVSCIAMLIIHIGRAGHNYLDK